MKTPTNPKVEAFNENQKRMQSLENLNHVERIIPIMHNPALPWFADSPYYKSLMNGTHGQFAYTLCKAWLAGDKYNREKLVKAFPEIFPMSSYSLY